MYWLSVVPIAIEPVVLINKYRARQVQWRKRQLACSATAAWQRGPSNMDSILGRGDYFSKKKKSAKETELSFSRLVFSIITQKKGALVQPACVREGNSRL